MKIEITKKSIITIVLSILLLFFLPINYYMGHNMLELLSFEDGYADVSVVFFFIYFVLICINVFLSLTERSDFSKLASGLAMAFLLFGTFTMKSNLNPSQFKSGFFFYLLATAAIVAVQFIMDKSKK